ncbi:MAG: hypothetical protein O8C56_09325 [Candidatus Methanoperedens sp.]|nr:hypothetical protein [Candidatus Methanoperedens sp.]
MSVNYELLRNMYPEWEPKTSPLLTLLEIFLAIALFLVIPYIYIKFVEGRLGTLRGKILQRLRAEV